MTDKSTTDRGALRKYFQHNPGRLIDKWAHYFDIYERHLGSLRRRPITMLEIGVYHGGSLQMWRHYLHPKSRIIGLDIDERTLALAEPGIEIRIGDQSDRSFMSALGEEIGAIDVVIDDGGHTMDQQIGSFEALWPFVAVGGVYLAEDLHTSYWPEFGGGYRRESTFIEYMKTLIDQQNAWHARPGDGLLTDSRTTSISGMHFYDSLVVLDKGVVRRPWSEVTGEPAFPLIDDR